MKKTLPHIFILLYLGLSLLVLIFYLKHVMNSFTFAIVLIGLSMILVKTTKSILKFLDSTIDKYELFKFSRYINFWIIFYTLLNLSFAIVPFKILSILLIALSIFILFESLVLLWKLLYGLIIDMTSFDQRVSIFISSTLFILLFFIVQGMEAINLDSWIIVSTFAGAVIILLDKQCITFLGLDMDDEFILKEYEENLYLIKLGISIFIFVWLIGVYCQWDKIVTWILMIFIPVILLQAMLYLRYKKTLEQKRKDQGILVSFEYEERNNKKRKYVYNPEADKKWTARNKEYKGYLKYRLTAHIFIKNKATLEDLEELKQLIKERESML